METYVCLLCAYVFRCWTTDILKEIMVDNFRMEFSSGLIRLAKEFVAREPEDIKKKIRAQLKVFRKYLKTSIKNGAAGNTTTVKNTVWKYDGKVNGKPDDLAFVFIMAREYAVMTQASPQYKYLAAANGWAQ